MSVESVITEHEKSGRYFEAGGVRSFALDQGSGEAVVCMHGVPASAFLYRKVVPELAPGGYVASPSTCPGSDWRTVLMTSTTRGPVSVASPLPPWIRRASSTFHLVVHDIGGPVGFELAAALPDRVASITVLNTLVEVDTFRRPWVMEPFAHRGIGEAYLRSLSKPLFRQLMRMQGIADMSKVSKDELGRTSTCSSAVTAAAAFLKIMRGFELTRDKRDLYVDVLGGGRHPGPGRLGRGRSGADGRQARRAGARRAAGARQHHPPPRQALPPGRSGACHRRADRSVRRSSAAE